MTFGAIIIGDEILSGRRSDKHLPRLIELLGARGLKLGWARYVGDSRTALVNVLRDSFASGDDVFSFGGIGATPDDQTRQAAAQALAVDLEQQPEAERLIRERFGDKITPHRLQMGCFPTGSEIIPNTYNNIPGFRIARHFFMPGFPIMAWPMIEWVLDTQFAHLHHTEDYIEQSIIIWERHEGELINLMERITQTYPQAALFSLPTVKEENGRHSVELGMKGRVADVNNAMAEIKSEVSALGFNWENKD